MLAFRLCCAAFLAFSVGQMLSAIIGLGTIGRRTYPPLESAIIAGALVLFAFVTSTQSLRASARLALFTNKLTLAILVAALIRVRNGLPSAWSLFSHPPAPADMASTMQNLSQVAFYVCPVALLATSLGGRCGSRKQVVLTAVFGLAVPVVVAVLATDFIVTAIQGGQFRNLLVALTSGDSGRVLPTKVRLMAITMFGAVRFMVAALTDSVPAFGGRQNALRLAVAAPLVVGVTLMPAILGHYLDTSGIQENLATALSLVAGMLTADALARRWRIVGHSTPEHPRRVDWISVGIFVMAWCVLAFCSDAPYFPFLIAGFPPDPGHPLFLPSYGLGFTALALGRAFQKAVIFYTHRLDPV
jgi:hypothetical protein